MASYKRKIFSKNLKIYCECFWEQDFFPACNTSCK